LTKGYVIAERNLALYSARKLTLKPIIRLRFRNLATIPSKREEDSRRDTKYRSKANKGP